MMTRMRMKLVRNRTQKRSRRDQEIGVVLRFGRCQCGGIPLVERQPQRRPGGGHIRSGGDSIIDGV